MAQMRLTRGLKQYGLVAIAIPGFLLLTAITTLADASPSPSGSPALPGDANHGATLYAQNCQVCHGASLEGNIGPALNPLDTSLKGASVSATFLIDIITNGRVHQPGDPKQTDMPAKGGVSTLTDQDIKDLAAFIIQQNQLGTLNVPLSPGELAKRTITWVAIGIIAMVFVTYLLAQYNMRWIARRAAARK